MNTITKSTLSASSLIIDFLPADYIDAYEYIVNTDNITNKNIEPEKILLNFNIEQPKWINFLVKLRNILVKPFGLKTDDDLLKGKIVAENENETVLQLSDSHLTTEVSIYLDFLEHNKLKIVCATLVHYHNKLGMFYFFAIKPFHKVIVKSLLRKSIK